MFWHMRLRLVSYFERAVEMNVWPRFRIPQVSQSLFVTIIVGISLMAVDCPEREATYVITNGGINDPDKV